MNEDYFKSLIFERLVEVAKNLHQLATELWEKQQENSENSSKPPSSDNPYAHYPTTEEERPKQEPESSTGKTQKKQTDESQQESRNQKPTRKAWILDDLRELIATIALGEKVVPLLRKVLAGLTRVCHLGKKADHTKLQALAKEILNDWDAVVAFVYHPELPATNNEAERALRHAVIARRISYGTRTREGSLAYSSLLSVIETCRLRQVNPWKCISSVIKLARKGLSPPPLPQPT
ncbi:MAG: transposase [Xenococcus sp. MO_188.B8]|nr:transposase [Xenococcus sp. MO_188.B8]